MVTILIDHVFLPTVLFYLVYPSMPFDCIFWDPLHKQFEWIGASFATVLLRTILK
jgi:hypothetical protein